MANFFARQLAVYASYHRDRRNRLTHFVGIPAIVLSLLPPLALWQVPLGGWSLTGAAVVAALAALGWFALDRVIGLAMALLLIPMVMFGEWVAQVHGATAAWWTFAVLFVGGWMFQIVGHVFEGRRPALLDNLFQAFIGPMFIVAELLMAAGLRRDLAAIVDPTPAAS